MADKKKFVNYGNVHLPFPYPMLDADGQQKLWPFKEEGFALIYANLDRSEKFVSIKDEGAIFTLSKMGFFGFNSNKEMNQFYLMERLSSGEKSIKTKAVSSFKAGFFSLMTADIPMAGTKFEHDLNRIELKQCAPRSSDQLSSSVALNSLKLGLEEAYFLSYVFGLLAIAKDDDPGHYYNLSELWSCFCQLQDASDCTQFAVRYAAYHYFRSKGWVVRNGFKFGTDYLLYKEGPPFFHALYSVAIKSRIEDQPGKRFQWNEISGLTRVSRNVRKELIICVVTIPKALTTRLTLGPECIQHFTIDLVRGNRWNSSKGEFDHSKIFHF